MNPPRPGSRHRSLWFLLASLALVGCGDRDSGLEPEGPSTPEYDYGTTLSRLPVDFTTHLDMAGEGQVTGRLVEGQLVIQGQVEGVESRITQAHVHRARPGLRGPPLGPLELVVAEDGTSATLTGSIDLTDELGEALAANELYIQVHSEANPDGVLRGWLFPPR